LRRSRESQRPLSTCKQRALVAGSGVLGRYFAVFLEGQFAVSNTLNQSGELAFAMLFSKTVKFFDTALSLIFAEIHRYRTWLRSFSSHNNRITQIMITVKST
jgi:hypothetical protein